MANESERPIEKLLRASAKKRREAGEGFALHPVNRRHLQAAVAQRFGSQEANVGFWSRWLANGWPRLAWGLAGAAAIILAVVLWLPSRTPLQSEVRLAKNEPTAQSRPATAQPARAPTLDGPLVASRRAAGSAPAPAENTRRDLSGAARGLEQQRQLADKDQSLVMNPLQAREESKLDALALDQKLKQAETGRSALSKEMPPAAPPATAAPAAPSGSTQKALANGPISTGEVEKVPSATKPATSLGFAASTPVETSTNLLAGGVVTRKGERYQFLADEASLATNSAVVTQHFTQSTSEIAAGVATFDRTATPPILSSFTLEQSGRDLRVVDSDGSVYTGYLEGADSTKSLDSDSLAAHGALALRAFQAPARNRESTAKSSLQASAGAYFFRVTGTNQTLKQPVVFSGNLLPATNQAPAALPSGQAGGGMGGAFGGATAARAGSDPVQKPLPAHISGTATVGRQQTRIEATAKGTAK